jgi:S1-C subfamily serine protease
MRPRDSAFAAELALRASDAKRTAERGRRLASEGAEATEQSLTLFSEKVARDADRQRSITQFDFATVHDRNDPAVAMIASDLEGTFIAGTAFCVSPTGLLVTNRHVVRAESGAAARRVRVLFADTRAWLPAHVVRMSDTDDLALIQLDVEGGDPYPVVAGVSRTGELARVGAPIASIGYPHAVDTPMEGQGLHVTARTTTAAGTVAKRLDDLLQVDSYAGRGSSGSPLFDTRGDVVGVIYGGAPESGGRIVYAVPAQRLTAFLGAEGQTLSR